MAINASSQLIVDLFEQPSFPLDGNFIASVCGAFGVFYFFVAAASVYIMHRTAFTLSAAAHAALAARLPRRLAGAVLAQSQRIVDVAIIALAYGLPLAVCIAWAATLAPAEPSGCWVYGLGVMLAGPAVLLGAYAVGRWHHRGYQVDGRTLVSGLLSVLLPLLLLLLLVGQRQSCPASERLQEFPHTALTAFIMAVSLVPAAALIYLSRGGLGYRRFPFPLGAEARPAMAQTVLIALGLRLAPTAYVWVQQLWLFGVTVGLLALYSIQVAVHTDETRQGEGAADEATWSTWQMEPRPTRFAGLYTSATILLIDAAAWLYSRCPLHEHTHASAPVTPLLAMVACRLCLILVVGEAYIFLVHAALLLLLGTLVGTQVSSHRFHTQTSQRHALERLVKRPGWGKRFSSFVMSRANTLTPRWRATTASGHAECEAVSAEDGPTPPPSPPLLPRSSAATASPPIDNSRISQLRWLLDLEDQMDLGDEHSSPPLSPPAPDAVATAESAAAASTREAAASLVAEAEAKAVRLELDKVRIVSARSKGRRVGREGSSWLQAAHAATTLPEVPLLFVAALWSISLTLSAHNDEIDPSCRESQLPPGTSVQPRSCRHPRVNIFGSEIAQWTFVLAAGLLALFLVLAWNVYLRLAAYEWALRRALGAAVVTEVLAIASGFAIYLLANAWNVLAYSIFAPPLLLFAAHAAHLWMANRMKMWSGDRARDLGFGLDLMAVAGCILGCVGFLYALGEARNALFIGILSFSVLLLLAAAAKFYATLRLSCFVALCTLLSLGLLSSLIAVYYANGFERREAVMLGLLAWPTVAVFAMTVLIWRGSYWVASRKVCALLVLSMLMMLGLIIAVILVASVRVGLGLLALWAGLLVSVLLSLLLQHLAATRRVGVWAGGSGALLLLVGVAIAGGFGRGMLAFTIASWTVAGSMLAFAFLNGPGVYTVRAGTLPIFGYDASSDLAIPKPASILAGLAALWVVLGWSVFAAYTQLLTPAAIAAFWATALGYVYALDASHNSQLDTSELCKDLTPRLVWQASEHVRQRVARRRLEHGTSAVACAAAAATRDEASLGADTQPDAQRGTAAAAFGACADALQLETISTALTRGDGATDFGAAAEQRLIELLDALRTRLATALESLAMERAAALTAALERGRSTNGSVGAPNTALWVLVHSLDRRRWALVSFATALTAHVLLMLRMAAELANAEQEDAISGVLSAADGARPRSAAARVAHWPHSQVALVREMRLLGSGGFGDSGSAFGHEATPGTEALAGSATVERFIDADFPPSLALAPPAGGGSGHPHIHIHTHPEEGAAATRSGGSSGHPILNTRVRLVDYRTLRRPDAEHSHQWRPAPDILRELSAREVVLFGHSTAELSPSFVRYGAEAEAAVWRGEAHEESFVIALRLVLSHAHAAARLRRAFSQETPSADGAYTMTLFNARAQRWEAVCIDDELPCQLASPTTGTSLENMGDLWAARTLELAPWHARSLRANELWLPLLHKAVAKLMGSYQQLACTPVPEVVVSLTGGVVQRIPLGAVSDGTPLAWELLQMWMRAGCLLLCEPPAAVATAMGMQGGAPTSSAPPLTAWHSIIAAHDDAKVQLLVLESAALLKAGAAASAQAVAQTAAALDLVLLAATRHSSSLITSPTSHGNARPATTRRSCTRADVDYVGLLDLPSRFVCLHIVRGLGQWIETTLSGTVPFKFQLRGRCSTAAAEAMRGVMIMVKRDDDAPTATAALSTTAMPLMQLKPFLLLASPPPAEGEAAPPPVDALIDVSPSEDAHLFADAPNVQPAELDGAVFVLSTAGEAGRSTTASSRSSIRASSRQNESGAGAPVHVSVSEGGDKGAPVHVSVSLLAPFRLYVSAYWTDEERVTAARLIEGALARRLDRRRLVKLRRAEYKRMRSLLEVLEVHARFLSHLNVLANVWRAGLRELMMADEADEGAGGGQKQGRALVDSIFPSLDTIHSMSSALSKRLHASNLGVHALSSLSECEHASFTCMLIRRLRDALREGWPTKPTATDARSYSNERHLCLELILGGTLTSAEIRSGGFSEELASSLGADPSRVILVSVVPSAAADGSVTSHVVSFELLPSTLASASSAASPAGAPNDSSDDEGRHDERQKWMALCRRAEGLAAALALSPDAPGATGAGAAGAAGAGVVRLSQRLAAGRLTSAIERARGLRHSGVSGPEGRLVVIAGAHTSLRDLPLDRARWDAIVAEFSTPAQGPAPAEAALVAPDATVATLAHALRGTKAGSVAEAFVTFADYLKVFSVYSSGLEAARSRVDAIRKLESGRAALFQCQQDVRTSGLDIHNWLVRPNQHLMRQPMLLEQLHALTPEAAPAKPALAAALAKVKAVVAEVDQKKFEHEQRLKLASMYTRMVGDDTDTFVLPHRYLLREGAFAQLQRRARVSGHVADGVEGSGGSGISGGSSDEEDTLGVRYDSFVRRTLLPKVTRRPTRYVVLCNDSLWYCELLRGNRYRLLHVFHFATRATPAAAVEAPPRVPTVIPACGQPPTALMLSDAAMTVLLQPAMSTQAATEQAEAWLVAIGDALDKVEALAQAQVPTKATAVSATVTGAGGPDAAAPLEAYRHRYRQRNSRSKHATSTAE